MSVNKCVLLLLLCSSSIIKSSLSHDASEIGFMLSVRHCTKKQPKVLAYCVLKQAIVSMDRAMESNTTWHINDFLSMKKNVEWKKPVERFDELQSQRRNADDDGGGGSSSIVTDGTNTTANDTVNATENIYSTFLRKATELLRSRTLEFSIPQNEPTTLRDGRALEETGKCLNVFVLV